MIFNEKKRLMEENIEKLNLMTSEEAMRYLMDKYGNRIALSSSLSLEDQVITHMMLSIRKNARIFTLDTGRLFPETYSLIDKTNMKYGIKMEIYFPDHEKVEAMTRKHGVNLFYESIEKRKECCNVRKIEPLNRALSTLDVWVCGLRREQSITRGDMKMVEKDPYSNVIKFNPLIDWSLKDVTDYIKANNIPYNPLHDKGYPSIGCQPCTRPVAEGEDIRSGRWWWEDPDKKECGLHKR